MAGNQFVNLFGFHYIVCLRFYFLSKIYSFPAFLSAFFLPLTTLVMILFLADFAFLSLNLSRSVRPALFFFMAILLAQLLAAQVSFTLFASISSLTTLDRALNGNLTLIGVRFISLIL